MYNILYTMIFLGSHRRLGTTSEQRTFRERQLFMHEHYQNLQNDIALLQLQHSLFATVLKQSQPGQTMLHHRTTHYLFNSYVRDYEFSGYNIEF